VYYLGDASNQLAPISSYRIVSVHSTYALTDKLEVFASVSNLFNSRYATWGILSDPTGVGAPGVRPSGVTNGPGVDNRFLSPAAPFEALVGARVTF
jgi:outer membrane receptor protein involved in Fe transport